MFSLVRSRIGLSSPFLALALGFGLLLSLTACKKQESAPAEAAPKTFASPQDAGNALADAAKSQNTDAVLAIFGPGSAEIISSGDAAEDKAQLNGFAQAYKVMNRWRKLDDGSSLLLVGADNQIFPIPVTKNTAGAWYFNVPAGKKEILARRIGRDEIAAIYVCGALAESQMEYFPQKHGGVKQYAQKLISDAGQQNGLYWESPQGAPRSPLGPLVAFASEEGIAIKPDVAKPYYGYYYRRLDNQGADCEGWREGLCGQWKDDGRIRLSSIPSEVWRHGYQDLHDQPG